MCDSDHLLCCLVQTIDQSHQPTEHHFSHFSTDMHLAQRFSKARFHYRRIHDLAPPVSRHLQCGFTSLTSFRSFMNSFSFGNNSYWGQVWRITAGVFVGHNVDVSNKSGIVLHTEPSQHWSRSPWWNRWSTCKSAGSEQSTSTRTRSTHVDSNCHLMTFSVDRTLLTTHVLSVRLTTVTVHKTVINPLTHTVATYVQL